jgi:hypothetical protein
MDNGMRLQRHLISFELKNTYVGIMPFFYPRNQSQKRGFVAIVT